MMASRNAPSSEDCIEILPVDLLDHHRPLVENLKDFSRSVGVELGWHYLLDLVWIITRLDLLTNKNLLDAGAGTGVLQWFLAQQGANVTSVDRMSRAALPLRFRRRFRVQGLRTEDLLPARQVFLAGFRRGSTGTAQKGGLRRLTLQLRELAGYYFSNPVKGCVRIYNQDLSNLEDIQTGSIDMVLAVSALEHNSRASLRIVVKELMRVLKPGGRLIATLVAGKNEDIWHVPSQAWCYTDKTLKQIFDLPEATPSNYSQYDSLFASLRDCGELRDGLAKFYFKSGTSGMPWGKWDPQYQPVGVCKIKPPLT
ncbi:MAG: hypothetical protein A2Z16_04925 [Chloroflexi bacterium RBG_16_54_18]|nr:MAG: hypothetical protein A2Z16_04925 [Chloroflexi bacterium RBG_16_54_18]